MLKKGEFKAKFLVYIMAFIAVVALVIAQGQLGLPGDGDVECPQLTPPLQKEGCTYTPRYDENRCIIGYDEKCIICPQWTPPAPDWCKDGKIVSGGVDENGCPLPPKCEPIKCAKLSPKECLNYDNCELVKKRIFFGIWERQSCVPKSKPVYRFLNSVSGDHFYTISEDEKNSVLKNLPDYKFEGIGFYAYENQVADTLPVYRFFNKKSGDHFYTISDEEKKSVLTNLPDYSYEGIAFYAYDKQAPNTLPVYMFFNMFSGDHFYTISEDESNSVLKNLPDYSYEGIGFYALEPSEKKCNIDKDCADLVCPQVVGSDKPKCDSKTNTCYCGGVTAPSGDSTISNIVASYPLVIKTTQRLAGAIDSLTWKGKEFINSYDHGRQLQSAAHFDNFGECYNPTEAGSRADGTGPTSTSALQALTASGNILTTQTQMAFWLRPGESTPDCGSARNTNALSDYLLNKKVTIGFGGMEHVIEHQIKFTLPRLHDFAIFEALTGYMPPEFSKFWTYNPVTKNLAPLSDGPGEQAFPVILATPDNNYAMGVYSPDLPKPNFPAAGYGRWRFDTLPGPGNAVVKWNCVFREGYPPASSNVPAGEYNYRCYSIVGSLNDVTNSMDQLYNYFKVEKPECKTDADCPQPVCITAPCPQYSCIDEKCVPIEKCNTDKDCADLICPQVVGGDEPKCDLKTNTCYCGGVCGDGYCDSIEKRDRTCPKDCQAEEIYSESFENGFGGWITGHYLQCEFDKQPCWPLEWSITRSVKPAYDGVYSLKAYLNGDHDDGTIWVERPFKVTPSSDVNVEISFYLWSESSSKLNNWPVVAYVGSNNPEIEEDFSAIGVTDEVIGWKKYSYSAKLRTDSTGKLWVAFGFGATFEVARTYFMDFVNVKIKEAEFPKDSKKCSDYSPEECLKYDNCELVKKWWFIKKCVEKPKCPKKAPAVCPIYECIEGAISVQNPDTCCYECKPVCGNNICETGECKEDEKCAYPCPQDCKKETTPKLLFKGTLPTELAPHGSGNVYAPEVLFENGVYKMWYGGQGNDGHDRIHYAESNDGVNWIKKGVVLDNGASNHVNDPSIVKIDKPKLTWSSAGPIAGKHCVQIIESADPHTWDDNYLCSDKDYGFAWSSAGPISEMHCTQVIETADPDTWDDNYLCSRIDYGAKWSSAGPISGMDCIQIIESADPHTWDDNYLCFSDLYYMYYTDAESGEDDRIHLAISSDGLTWTKRGMVLDAGPWDWNKVRVGRPAVIYDSNTFKMWYDTPDFNAGKLYIGYATSNDGVTWTKNPTPTHALRGGAVDVKKWKGIYFMLLEGRNGISLSTSKDGISWADQGIWLKKDDSAFDKFGLVTPFLLILNDKPDTVYFGGASLEGWNGNAVGMIKLNGDELNKFVTGAICGNNICEEGEKETCPQDCQKPTCTDSDGGKDVFVKGTAKSNGNIATDYCFDELNVNEAVCLEDGTIGIYTYGCPNRCKDGACVKGPQEQTFRNAEWACADGYKESQGEPTSCKTVETWLTYAGKSCAGRCSGICPACISEPCPPCITTCGISYFSVATPCDSGGIVLPQGKLELSKIEFSIDKGGSEILTAGVTNTKNTPLYYKIRITPILGPTGEPFSIENPPWFQFAQNQVYTLAQGNSEKRDVRIAIPTNVLSGSYLLKFDIIDDDLPAPNNVYASKDFFVVVKG